MQLETGLDIITIKIEPFILVDFLTTDEPMTILTSLTVYAETDDVKRKLIKKRFIFPTKNKISIDKDDLKGAKKIIIYDELLDHSYEISDFQNLSLIRVPTGMRFGETSRNKTLKVDKFNKSIEIHYSGNDKTKYELIEN